MIIAVIDGMGGGIGAQIISSLREELPTYIEIYALGTNSIATSAMMKSHANKGATGENAIVVSSKKANIIVAPIAVTMPNTMMGEVTSKISEAICDSEALKILLPIMPENFSLVGVENKPLSLLIKDTIKVIKKDLWKIYDQTKQKYPIIIFKGYDKKNLYIRYLEGLDKNGLKVFYKINNFEYWEEWDIDHIQIIGTTIEK